MGRRPKQGLDYFPFDVTLPDDPKLYGARQKFGYAAQMVYICLLCILYKDKGYYIPFKGKQRNEVAWQIENMLHGKYPIKTETILMIIDELVACGLFSDDLFSRDIITSKRAQEVYYSATVDRTSLNINFDLWLLSKNDMEELSSRSPILHTFISRSTSFQLLKNK